jgi:type IV secretory pathway VirB10-like protein
MEVKTMRKLGYLLVCFFFVLGLTVSTIGCKKKAEEAAAPAPTEQVTPAPAPAEQAPAPAEQAPAPAEKAPAPAEKAPAPGK